MYFVEKKIAAFGLTHAPELMVHSRHHNSKREEKSGVFSTDNGEPS